MWLNSMKNRLLLFMVTTVFLCGAYTLLSENPFPITYSQTKDPYILYSSDNEIKRTNTSREIAGINKTVLIWTKFFGSYRGWDEFYGPPGKNCPRNCKFTFDRSKLKSAEAVMFHASNLYRHEEDMPVRNTTNQVWILHNTECPTKTDLQLSQFDNIFNWTSMVRSDSDVPVYYGRAIRGTAKDNAELIAKSSYKNKTMGVAWAAGNCYSNNGREGYVRRLQEHIPVDVYGYCGKDKHLKCPRGKELNCLSKYKFYLAFENSNCHDYITEKLWRTYTLGSIPVVRGGGNYTKVAPPGSYINTADFQTPKELADYLWKVGSDKRLYGSYMKWHRTHTLRLQDGQYWCDLCTALHERTGRRQVYRHLERWFNQDTCHKSWVSIYFICICLNCYMLLPLYIEFSDAG